MYYWCAKQILATNKILKHKILLHKTTNMEYKNELYIGPYKQPDIAWC